MEKDNNHFRIINKTTKPDKNHEGENPKIEEEEDDIHKDDKNDLPKEEMKKEDILLFMRTALDHWSTTTIFSILTVYALFADDLKMLVSDKVKLLSYFSVLR